MRDVKEPDVRRAEILDAAVRLFIEQGYMNTTTQDIVDKAKISRGLLYYHFKNKEDILYRIIERYSEPLLKNIYAISYNRQMAAIEKIRAFMDVTFISPESISEDMIELQKIVDIEQNRYLIDKLSHKLIDSLTVYFAHIIEQGIKENSFFVEYPLETATFLMTSYVFVSNTMNMMHKEKEVNNYFNAFELLLERTLSATYLFKDKQY